MERKSSIEHFFESPKRETEEGIENEALEEALEAVKNALRLA